MKTTSTQKPYKGGGGQVRVYKTKILIGTAARGTVYVDSQQTNLETPSEILPLPPLHACNQRKVKGTDIDPQILHAGQNAPHAHIPWHKSND
jgi:hypothetical protein